MTFTQSLQHFDYLAGTRTRVEYNSAPTTHPALHMRTEHAARCYYQLQTQRVSAEFPASSPLFALYHALTAHSFQLCHRPDTCCPGNFEPGRWLLFSRQQLNSLLHELEFLGSSL